MSRGYHWGTLGGVRAPALIALLVLSSSASNADRLVNVPTGTKVPFRAIRFEALAHQHTTNRGRLSLAVGIGESWDFEATLDSARDGKSRGTFDLSYNYIPAFPDASPGISVGVRDALDATLDGSGVYAAATFRYGQFGEKNGETPAEVTIGAGAGAFRGPFTAAMLPVTNSFRLLAEHDSRRFVGGLELRPFRDLRVRWIHTRDFSCVSVGWTYRF